MQKPLYWSDIEAQFKEPENVDWLEFVQFIIPADVKPLQEIEPTNVEIVDDVELIKLQIRLAQEIALQYMINQLVFVWIFTQKQIAILQNTTLFQIMDYTWFVLLLIVMY